MSRRSLTTVLAVFAAAALTATAYAAPGAKAHGPKASAHATTKPSVAKGPRVKSTAAKPSAAAVKPVKVKSTGKPASAGPKITKTKSTTTTASTKPAKATKVSRSTSTTTTSVTWVPNNPVAQKLSTKTNLMNKVTGVLPAGTDLNAATAGFKNFGQFVAAVNVSNNLGIPFADLKANMTGIRLDGTPTGEPTLSLGRSIQDLKPAANAGAEATKATKQADSDIK
jgi:hypothetical protein